VNNSNKPKKNPVFVICAVLCAVIILAAAVLLLPGRDEHTRMPTAPETTASVQTEVTEDVQEIPQPETTMKEREPVETSLPETTVPEETTQETTEPEETLLETTEEETAPETEPDPTESEHHMLDQINPTCRTCGGRGKVDCRVCHGSGQRRGAVRLPDGTIQMDKVRCRKCFGRGRVSCEECDGTGMNWNK
jgi:hypothetical protein